MYIDRLGNSARNSVTDAETTAHGTMEGAHYSKLEAVGSSHVTFFFTVYHGLKIL